MKRSSCGRRALSPLWFATALPAAGLALMGTGAPAQAQANKEAVETVLPTAALAPQAQPAAPAKPVQDTKPAAPPADPNAPVISEIIVVGAKTLSKTYIVTLSGHSVGDPCNADVLSDMRTRLFASEYFGGHSIHEEDAVRVEAAEKEKGKCQVTITVDENDTLTGIQLTGTGPLKVEDVLPLIHLKPGSAYNGHQFLLDSLDIQSLYQKKGYIASVAGEEIDPNGILNVTIVVTRVAEIKIVGNKKTRRSLILRVMNTKEGDYLNIHTLDRDVTNVLNTDLFENVNPTDSQLGGGRVAVTMNVTEKRTGTITAGVGYSNRAQIIGFAEVVETNFQGRGEAVNVRGEVGGVSGRPSLEVGFTEPYLDKQKTSGTITAYTKTVYRFSNSLSNNVATQSTSGTNDRYYEQRTGGTLTLSRPFLQTYRGALSFRGEDVRTDNLDLSVQNAQIIQNGPIFVLSGQLLHNTRDLDIDPVTGGFQNGNITVGHANLNAPRTFTGITIPGISGSVNFSKLFLEARQYFSLSGPRRPGKLTEDKSSIAMRFQLGSSAGTLPFFEQYFVGGSENLRGYRDDRFWGNNLFFGSVEFRQPIARKLKGVLFLDVGDAWGGSYDNVSIPGFTQNGFAPHVGVGLGIRVNTPIGPLRLDYGIGDEGGRTHFGIGPTF